MRCVTSRFVCIFYFVYCFNNTRVIYNLTKYLLLVIIGKTIILRNILVYTNRKITWEPFLALYTQAKLTTSRVLLCIKKFVPIPIILLLNHAI